MKGLLLLVVFAIVGEAAFRDFVIENQDDLRHLGDSDYMTEVMPSCNYGEEENTMNDICSYEASSDVTQNDFDRFGVGCALQTIMQEGHINIDVLRETLKNLMNHPRFGELLANEQFEESTSLSTEYDDCQSNLLIDYMKP